MNKVRRILRSKYFPVIALATVNLLFAYFYVKLPFTGCKDLVSYESAVGFITGGEYGMVPWDRMLSRLLTTPATLLSGIFFGLFTGGLKSGLAVLNIFFCFAIVVIFYKLVFEIWKSRKIAFISTVLFQSNYWFFSHCMAYIADLGGNFFFILTNLFAVKYYFSKNRKYFYCAILSSTIGVFFKEFGALGMISLGMVILLSGSGWRKKIKDILEAAVLFLILPGIYYLWFYFKLDYSYLDLYAVPANIDSPGLHGFVIFIKVFGWLYFAGWPIFLFGLWQIKKHFKASDYKIMLALLPASLAFLAWPFWMQRTAFVLVPWLAICSGFGLAKVKNKYIIALILIIYIIVGYNIPELLKIINVPF